MDQCKTCSARGNMKKCIEADCTIHESWYVLELIKQLQNTSSNKKYTAPQATPKSCPGCNKVATIDCLYSRIHTGNC